ncbi:MAG: hypothetical protein OCC49_19435 [Fibrobacterales bacterium]
MPENSPVIFNENLWDEADALVTELRELNTLALAERARATDPKNIRDQALTPLRQSEVEIKGWVDVAFQDSPEIRKEFNRTYGRRQYLKNKYKKAIETEVRGQKERLA